MNHTPTPWMLDGDDIWHKGESYDSATDPHRYTAIGIDRQLRDSCTAKANAAYIVLAVNAHADLCEALKEMLDGFPDNDTLQELMPEAGPGYRMLRMNPSPTDADVLKWRAALKKADSL